MPTMTAAQRREQGKADYNAFVASCPTRQLFATISDKGGGLVRGALADGPVRYNGLATTVAGISQKMLTQTLRALERDGLVTRTVTAAVPVRVDYELTALGHTLLPLMLEIKRWAETHMDEVDAARAAYEHSSGQR